VTINELVEFSEKLLRTGDGGQGNPLPHMTVHGKLGNELFPMR
jgi:hypothetical protein